MRRYRLTVRNGLLFTRCAVKHGPLFRVVTLLIDTGASQTILSWGTLASLGLDPAASALRRPITTANGLVWMPESTVDEFHALGESISKFPVLAHTLPLGSQVNGILGMNFLMRFDFWLSLKEAIVEV